jgi:hypothetical protein
MTIAISDNGLIYGTSGSAHQLFSVSASVATNALTVSLDPTTVVFRNSTLSSGTLISAQNASQLSLVVPSGATLGTVSGVQSRIVILALYNSGAIQLGVVNIAGGTQLDETNLLSTTVISSGASSNSVVYSSTALTNVPYKVVGIVDSNQTTAGTWASAPTLVQGSGGQALMSMGSLGYGQTWQSVTRTMGTTYYNTTGRTIALSARCDNTSAMVPGVYVNGVLLMDEGQNSLNYVWLNAIIPPGASYSLSLVSGSGTVGYARELR